MSLPAAVRKAGLTAHVACSVGWLGAVAAFLALAAAGLTSDDPELVRGAYVTMELTGWAVLVPLALGSLATGLVQSLGTEWGVFRHYWVLFKLAINVVATALLLAYTEALAALADGARAADDVEAMRSASPLVHAGAALALLLVATTLGVVKPRGLTPYGLRRQRRR